MAYNFSDNGYGFGNMNLQSMFGGGGSSGATASSGGIKFDDLLRGAGSLSTAFGQGKGTAATQLGGFTTLPKEQKDFMTKQIFDMIKQYQARPYEETTVPMRGLNAEDLDPIFGSRARVDMANYYNQNAMPTESAAQTETVTPKGDTAYGMAALNNMLAQRGGQTYKNPWVGFQKRATPADYADLSKALGSSNDFTSQQVIDILNRGRRG